MRLKSMPIIVRAAMAGGLLSGSLLMAGCGGVTVQNVVGGPSLALPDADRDRIGVRFVWVEASPRTLAAYLRRYDPDYGWPGRDAFERAAARNELDRSLQSDVEFEVRQELKACAKGEVTVDVAIRIDDLSLNGGSDALDPPHALTATAEFLLVEGGAPIARYVLPVAYAPEPGLALWGGPVELSINDPMDKLAELLGRNLCLQAFGRNPRPHPLMNTTR